MALLMLGAGRGSTVGLHAEGPDAEEAVKAVRELIEAGFHEEE
jgi:phosphocarrier protein